MEIKYHALCKLCALLQRKDAPLFVGRKVFYGLVFSDYFGGSDLVTKSCPTLTTPWTAACQVPLSIEFSRQDFPSPGDLPNPGIKLRSSTFYKDVLVTHFTTKMLRLWSGNLLNLLS